MEYCGLLPSLFRTVKSRRLYQYWKCGYRKRNGIKSRLESLPHVSRIREDNIKMDCEGSKLKEPEVDWIPRRDAASYRHFLCT